jgi:hypothetical protein
MTPYYIVGGYLFSILLAMVVGERYADKLPRRHRPLIPLYSFFWPLAMFVGAVAMFGTQARRAARRRER